MSSSLEFRDSTDTFFPDNNHRLIDGSLGIGVLRIFEMFVQ